ncbi:NACHT, LRR and PYD domains-containing protein 14-like [Rhinatrema bivittatum]|uniref:NACHT, LRR and PYD domains-containing protein 14-like n=1 Tax=Rhinatrema bivittatum TaxID=194408 RepID=UPI00112CC6D7|nr:NACHT, LRR and PYD domains-containing protein 14-like [Rhinatrema bivittatum]
MALQPRCCAEDLCAALRHNATLLKLDLSKNAFTAQSVSSFVQLILTSPSLRELQLGRNRLEDSGVRLFSEALGNPTCKLQRLGLRENNLTDCCLRISAPLSAPTRSSNTWICAKTPSAANPCPSDCADPKTAPV